MSEQHKPIVLVFKIGADKYHAFNVIAWKVRSEHVLQLQDGKIVCDCQRYRFESKCPHAAALQSVKHFVRGDKDWRKHEKKIEWQDKDYKYIIVSDESKDYPGAMHPDVGDLSAFGLVALLALDTIASDTQELMDDASSYLNPQRIFVELKASIDQGVSLIDDEVKKAGKAVPPLSKKDIDLEDDFDEALTTGSAKSVEPQVISATTGVAPLDWSKVKRPNPNSFYVRSEVWEQLLYTMAHGGNVLITGPSGSGKTELAYIAAKAMSMSLAAFNFGAMQEPRTTLIGATQFDPQKGTFTNKSRFASAVSADDGCILMDELSRDRGGSAHNIILTLLDRQGYMSLDEHEDSPIIHKGEKVCFVATANLGMEYTGTEQLDKALRDRMDVVIDMDFPTKEFEVKILINRCPGLRARHASRLVDVATRQRSMAVNDGEFVEQISTRMLLAAGQRIGNGMEFDNAVQFSICNHFSNEGGDASDRTKVLQIVQKGGK